MSFRLRLTCSSRIPINVEGILPEKTGHLSAADLARVPIRHGNQTVELGTLFQVSHADRPGQLVWEGDLSCVHWLGHGMTGGAMVIDGNIGRHLGSQMSGGSIQVFGNAGDFVGCEMRGGQIRIGGDAADYVGAAYPGNSSGTNRGTILVTGNAGHAVGFALRRGTIVIGGHLGKLAGWNMLAGTIVVGKRVGPMVGKGMVRGTVLLASPEFSGQNEEQLPPTFSQAGSFRPVVVHVLSRWMQKEEMPQVLNAKRYLAFHGDHLKGGRGEVLVASSG